MAAILDGSKTSTTGLAVQYELEGEPLPTIASRCVLVDSDDRPVAVLETTGVSVVPLAEVGPAHARDQGEGHQTVAQWRSAHEQFFHSQEVRTARPDPDFTVDDETRVVLERFRVLGRLDD